MKKSYIIPDMKCHETGTESDLLTNSIGSVVYDGDAQPIETGEDAGDGDVSDSRGYKVWYDGDY